MGSVLMPIIIPQIKGTLTQTSDEIIAKALKTAGINSRDIAFADIYKTSVDARRRDKKGIHFVYSVCVSLKDKNAEQRTADEKRLTYAPYGEIDVRKGSKPLGGRIVIAGFGPAGMFCALTLAENGYKPLVLERGSEVGRRVEKVSNFWRGGELDEQTNAQFGEGGAGTFSDGKLTTRIKDPLCRYVLERLTLLGAPKELLTKAKPHIGTDKLRDVVKDLRKRIIECGGEIMFDTRLDGISLSGGRVTKVSFSGAETGDMQSGCVVAAIGHSARDTVQMLQNSGAVIQSKPFAVGVRIEHTQRAVNESLYGRYADDPLLPVGEYQMSYTQKDGQACYTFCMCPGGVVVPAASERGGVVVNGMSEYARNGVNANSALVVPVNQSDFGNSPLGGMEFARKIEQTAYAAAGNFAAYTAPACTVGGFLSGTPDLKSEILPTYARGVVPCDISSILPNRVTDMLKKGLGVFSTRMRCFKDDTAILTAPETRTSSPVRILRNDSAKAVGIENLYPCGEGAGYAGGITSSAVDGIKTALKIMEEYAPY